MVVEKQKLHAPEKDLFVILDVPDFETLHSQSAKGSAFFVHDLTKEHFSSRNINASLRLNSLVFGFTYEIKTFQISEIYGLKKNIR